jgi:hypothetical protein
VSLSQVNIINIALSKIGDYYISSLTEGTKQQIHALIHWENCRDSLLQSYKWNFATERVRLARLAETPIGYDYVYQLPNDHLKTDRMSTDGDFTGDDSIDYKIHGKKLLTDETTCYIEYRKQVTDPSYYTPLFSKVLAVDLALALAEPLGMIPANDKQLLLAERVEYVNEARGVDFEEGQSEAGVYYSMTACRDN